MLHAKRRHRVVVVDDIGELARKLTTHTWTLCTGFRHGGWLFLNDSFSEDGAQEYGVLRAEQSSAGTHDVCEAVTFGWMNTRDAELWLRQWVNAAGDIRVYGAMVLSPHPEGPCAFCA